MKSRRADWFNHDRQASTYDRVVLDESDPIRAGYAAVQEWVARTASAGPGSVVLDLGCGTGNLALRLGGWSRLVCVDTSLQMLRRAREKLAGRQGIECVQTDLLEYLGGDIPRFDSVVSAYAIHHLEQDEKDHLLGLVADALVPGGRAVIGDLMFAHPRSRERFLASCRTGGRGQLADAVEEESYWDVSAALQRLRGLGLIARARRFSELSWGVWAIRPRS